MTEQAAQNTDRELFREDTGDSAGSYYENSIHVTADSQIGMNVGGLVITRSIAGWHGMVAEGERLRRWKAEAAETLMGWEAAFNALPESVRDANLGRLKSDVVREYIAGGAA